jgi:16S rRNA (guanine527-N7)-methyltransferase
MALDDRARALALCPVSRETLDRLDALVALVRRWQPVKNLISNKTLDELWLRHVADSLQLADLRPDVRTWADLGAGAGFPGLVIACTWHDTGRIMHLVESNHRKCAFLQEAARTLGLSVTVHNARIEDAIPHLMTEKIEVVSARALASLTQLIHYCAPLVDNHAEALFLKGQDVDKELTEATKYWNISAHMIQSKTDPDGQIVSITKVETRAA